MQHLKWHEELTDGVGKCGVPMWYGFGGECFCDAPAYGPQEEGQMRYGDWHWQGGRRVWIPGYSSGLACYSHGGPREKVEVKSCAGK